MMENSLSNGTLKDSGSRRAAYAVVLRIGFGKKRGDGVGADNTEDRDSAQAIS